MAIYPNSARIRQRLQTLATTAANAPFCSIHNLTQSHGGRDVTYLRIGRPGTTRKALIVGGLHAREWAPPTSVLTCFEDLLAAFHANRGITYRNFTIDHATIQSILNNVTIYVAPMMNPDGYEFTLNTNKQWRKNRRPVTPPNTGPNCIGVDLNRNFDVAWDIDNFYSSPTMVNATTNPCDPEVYIGPQNPFSEPESTNVRTLLDEGIQYFLDCHSRGRLLLHPWAIETNQTTVPGRTFLTVITTTPPTPGPLDGNMNNTYEEYIAPDDLRKFQDIGRRMQIAIQQATNTTYTLQEGARLYCASGTSFDYAYSRHLVSGAQTKVWAFTIECGSNAEGMFWPRRRHFPKIKQEVHAAILTMLRYAATDPNPAAGIAAPSSRGCGCVPLLAGAALLGAAGTLAGVLNA